jgi:hypothetical protein
MQEEIICFKQLLKKRFTLMTNLDIQKKKYDNYYLHPRYSIEEIRNTIILLDSKLSQVNENIYKIMEKYKHTKNSLWHAYKDEI